MNRNGLKSLALVALGMVLGVLVARWPGFMAWEPSVVAAEPDPAEKGEAAKPASDATRQANARFAKELPFADKRDFADAKRGLIAPLPDGGVVKDDEGNVIWALAPYSFIKPDQEAPESVNPSLWRQAQLLSFAGLFKVTDSIYQVRGYDLSNITFIEGKEGVTIIDPLISPFTARASLDLYFKHRPKKPIVAVIYTHSHIDHYGGVKGVVDEKDVQAGKVRVIAPEHFTNEALSENVIAGNAMGRRSVYMYGPLLPRGPRGQTTAGLGLSTPGGLSTLILPTEIVSRTGQKLTIDGLTYEFQMAPHSEAPTEMHFLILEQKALCPAENATHTLHNLYTLRGAKARDARAWVRHLDVMLEMFGDRAEVLFAPHHWPLWGNERVHAHVAKQRDTYKYLHDQTLRLANHGYTMVEIAEQVQLPPSLQANWASHGYYGSVNHNVKSIYNFYLGWFDANPATLHQLPPADAAKKYVDYMGGADAVLARARKDFAQGEYRWVAQAVNHVVLADPSNKQARHLQADALEQLGYQAENATWRNFYLTGALELRQGKPKGLVARAASPDTVRAMPLDLFLDFLAVHLNGPKAAGKKATVNLDFTDTKEKYVLMLDNSVLNYSRDKQAKDAECTVSISRATLNEIIMGKAKLPEKITAGDVRIKGNAKALQEILSLLDTFDLWFDIVTPNPSRK